MQALLDEVQVTFPLLRAAIVEVLKRRVSDEDVTWFWQVRRGKLGDTIEAVCEQEFWSDDEHWSDFGSACWRATSLPSSIHGLLRSPLLSSIRYCRTALEDPKILARGALLATFLEHSATQGESKQPAATLEQWFRPIRVEVAKHLRTEDKRSAMACAWALAAIDRDHVVAISADESCLVPLFRLWCSATPREVDFASCVSWVIRTQPLLPRNAFSQSDWGPDADAVLHKARPFQERDHGDDYDRALIAAVIVGWYQQSPSNDHELLDMANECLKNGHLMDMDTLKAVHAILAASVSSSSEA